MGSLGFSEGLRCPRKRQDRQRSSSPIAQFFRPLRSHLEIPVHNAQVMQVLDSIQHLEDEAASIPFCVESFLHDAVKQLST